MPVEFYDAHSGCLLKEQDDWLYFKNPNGNWITWRKSTADDRCRIIVAQAKHRPTVLLEE